MKFRGKKSLKAVKSGDLFLVSPEHFLKGVDTIIGDSGRLRKLSEVS